MVTLGIFGYGRMGKILESSSVKFSEISGTKIYLKNDDIGQFIQNVDLIVDFSNKEGTAFLVDSLLESTKFPHALVIGSTDLQEDTKNKINKLSEKLPIMHEPNFSFCTNLQAYIAEKLALLQGRNYDVDILDIHHKHKLDSPSGTSYMIARSINEGLMKSGLEEHNIITNRDLTPKRGSNEIAIASIRAGNFCGEHQVMFSGEYDSFSITHKVHSREIFATGAIEASLWIKNKQNGIYKIRDMLGLF